MTIVSNNNNIITSILTTGKVSLFSFPVIILLFVDCLLNTVKQ